jgi:O-methyltransferase
MLSPIIRAILPDRLRLLLGIARRGSKLPLAELRALRVSLDGRGGQGMHGQQFRFAEDGLSTIHNCDFLKDPRFQRALSCAEKTDSWHGWPMRWRAYIVCWCAEWAMHIPGDFVECGVNRGGYARMILEYVTFETSGKRMFLFDTFRGFSDTHLLPEEQHLKESYSYSDCLTAVKRTFSGLRSVDIVPGTVPETLAMRTIEHCAYLSIDMNCVQPEIAAAEYFWDKMSSGGVIVLDDYGQTAHIAQKLAFDDFARARGVSILSLPTSQGLIFKP